MWFALVAAALIPAVAHPAHGQDSLAQIRGRVISRAEQPVAQAEVTLIGTAQTVFTDSAGSFALRGVAPGLAVLQVRRIGFRGQVLKVQLAAGESRNTEIMLDPGPQLLPEVTVTEREAKPLEFGWTTKYDEFFRRRNLGLPGGTFIGAEQIKRRTAIHTHELLEQYVPGARVIVHCLGDRCTEIQFPRCSPAVGYVGVWVDGKRFNWPAGFQQAVGLSSGGRSRPKNADKTTVLAEVLDVIPPSEIQFMEVYRGIGSIPAEYSGGCGAILIWTK